MAASRNLARYWHNEQELSTTIKLFTGHGLFKFHTKTIGTGADATCKFCEEDKEDSLHLLCDCPTLALIRYHHWGIAFLSRDQLVEKGVTELLKLATEAKLMV